ncbi:tyrosine-type recombinase/integrase [Veronia pacifica]|uniref:Integrase n=1 Tax=Veronia pacifica TaxID=1080227 RepID=A0A1C3EAL4_9GAMM|nr:tyrosine-type recombinase/integrase [Veronia pacifica]ODA30268.1 integrase [Veronia pacifica]
MKKIKPMTNQEEITVSTETFCQPDIDLSVWQALTQNQYSHNSLLSFQNDWRTFVNHCIANRLCPLPADVTTVRDFAELTAKERKVSSVRRYTVTISLVHRCHSYKDPARHREVKFLMNRLLQEKSDQAGQATPFHLGHLEALTEKLEKSDRLKDIRDLLIWTLSFEGMLKRSELAALPFDAISTSTVPYLLNVGETPIELSNHASLMIDRWFEISGITDGPLLRRINKHQQLGEKPMDHSSIYRVFRRAADELGMGQQLTFSGQSPRVGASQDLAEAGMSIKEIQHQGRWKSPAMPAQYVGNTQARDEAMAKYKRKLEKE